MPKYFTQPGESVIGGLASDDIPRHARLDDVTHAMEMIDYEHHEIHAGSHYFYSEAFTLSATTDAREYSFVTPNTTKWAHMVFHMSGQAITETSLWEDSQYTTTDALTVYNSNRNSTDTADCALYLLGVTGTTDTGTRIWHNKSGSATQQSRDGVTVRNEGEIILKQNSNYRLAFATESTGNFCNFVLQWYEHTSKS